MAPSRKRTKKIRLRNRENDSDTTPSIYLPLDIIDVIFTFLPIKIAIQFGLLAKRFKDIWMHNRTLNFGRSFAQKYSTSKYFAIVDNVLSHHVSPTIHSFSMYFDPTGCESKVRDWIKIIISKGVEELNLDFFGDWNRRMFHLGTLELPLVRVLKLSYCEFSLPQSLDCLRLLKILVFKNVNVTTTMIEIVIENCKHLETLDIAYCRTLAHINILADDLKYFQTLKVGDCPSVSKVEIASPTLCTFHYCGKVVILTFVKLSELKDVILNFKSRQSAYVPHYLIRNALWNISNIQVLTVTSVFLEGLTSFYFDLLRGKIKALQNLVEFQLFVEGSLICNPYDLGAFIAHCPLLERVFIDIKEPSLEGSMIFELHHKRNLDELSGVLNNLKFVRLRSFRFLSSELKLVKFLLQKANNLENLVVTIPKGADPKVIAISRKYHGTLDGWKASPKAKIGIYQDFNEQSPIDPIQDRNWH